MSENSSAKVPTLFVIHVTSNGMTYHRNWIQRGTKRINISIMITSEVIIAA